MVNLHKPLFLTILLKICIISANAQEGRLFSEDPLPLDSSIRYGQLPNGFTYFIKSIPEPQSKLYLRLDNKVGSNQDDPDQLNAAHAVEHLAFKATKNFPLGILHSGRLASLNIGMYDLGASSGLRSTQYYFDAPKDSIEALNLGLLWFKDIATGLHLKDSDINQVRGELRQEAIFRNGDNLNEHFASIRLDGLLFPCSTDRIDFFEHHENFEPETLRRFYRDWYRPDLLALTVVGNIEDLEQLESQIKKTFTDIPKPEGARKLIPCDAEYYKRPPQFAVVERPADTSKVIQNKEVVIKLLFRDPVTKENLNAKKGLERLSLMQLLTTVIKQRFRDSTHEYQSFKSDGGYFFVLRATPPGMEITISLENNEEQAVKKTIYILQQIQKYGVSNLEWEKIKKERLQSLDVVDTMKSNYWVNEIEKYYNYGEALPANKQIQIKQWLASSSLEQFNDMISEFLSKSPEDIGIIAPAGHKVLSYTEKEVRSWIKDAYQQQIAPYKLPEIPAKLMSAEEVKKLQEVDYLDNGRGVSGAREVVLGNGVRVILKSFTPDSKNERKRIKLQGYSLQGAKSFPEEMRSSALNAPAIIRNAGVNGINKLGLNRFLAKTSLLPGSVSPYVEDQETGIYGDAALEDSEIMLQLIYLYFTRPNRDKTAFKDWKTQEYKAFRDPSYSLIDIDFKNAIKIFLGESPVSSSLGKKSRQGKERFEGLEETDFDIAYEAYEKLFGNSKDFTFIISGDFDIDALLPLVQKYLGNLCSSSYSFPYSNKKGDSENLPKGPLFVELPAPEYYRMKNINYGISFIKKAKDPNDWKEQIKVEALAGITTKKAWAIRFEKGYSLYDIGVGGRFNEEMGRYEISSVFDCVPEESSQIRQEFKQIISEIKSGLISKEEFKEGLRRMYFLYDANKANQPRVMHQRLYKHYRYKQPWTDPVELEKYLRTLTVEDIVETANRYYTQENLFEFKMKDRELKEDF